MNKSSVLLLVQAVIGTLAFFLFLFRERIGRWSQPASMRLARTILPPSVAWMPGGGPGVGKCARCRKPVTYSKIAPGEVAYTCPNCGETATWGSEPAR